jgi:cysteine synthase
VFFDHYVSGDPALTLAQGSRIEGIGRPRVEASFVPGALDAMVKVPDLWSLAAMHALSVRLGRRVGGSTGTNLIASLACARAMQQRGQEGSIVTLLCDDGERYRHSYFDDAWLQAQGLDCGPESDAIEALMQRGDWPDTLRRGWRLAGDLA